MEGTARQDEAPCVTNGSVPSAGGALENAATVRVFLLLRMMVLALVVGTGIMIMQFGGDEPSVRPMYALLVLSYVVGGVYYGAIRFGVSAAIALWALMVADIMVETALVHFSGGVASQFSLIFCLSIIAAAFLLRVHGGLGIALLASIVYVCYGLLENHGILTPPMSDISRGDDASSNFLETYMHVCVFFLVGAVGGYLAERMNRKGRQLDTAKAELKRLRIDTDNILRNMSSGVLVIDSDGIMLTINPTAEEILGIDGSTAEERPIGEVFAAMPALAVELRGALTSEKNKSRHEINVKRSDGRDLPLGISISLLKDDKGKRRGIITVFQDLTEVRDMQERVRKADRLAAIGELSAGIAHEIRNPLASISGSIEMLSNELRLNGENRRLMELIMKESDRLDRIITDFLEFARLRPPSKEDVDVASLIEEVVFLLKNNTAVKSKIVTEIGHDDGCVVRVDEEQMKQVFINLAINACEAMPRGGTLSIVSRTLEAESLSIAFRDEGEGISHDVRNRLFEPFFTTKEGGTGLGLAIANKIVEAHGGSIDVRSYAGGGAEVSVVFPSEVLRWTQNSSL